jgi:hypothetical protein
LIASSIASDVAATGTTARPRSARRSSSGVGSSGFETATFTGPMSGRLGSMPPSASSLCWRAKVIGTASIICAGTSAGLI